MKFAYTCKSGPIGWLAVGMDMAAFV
jgi:hypothetical protein